MKVLDFMYKLNDYLKGDEDYALREELSNEVEDVIVDLEDLEATKLEQSKDSFASTWYRRIDR